MKVEPQEDGTILIRASDDGTYFVRKVQSVTDPFDDSRHYQPRRTGNRRYSDIPINWTMYDPRDPQSSGGGGSGLSQRDQQQSAAARKQFLQEMIQKTRKENPGWSFQKAWEHLQKNRPEFPAQLSTQILAFNATAPTFEGMTVVTHPD